MSQPNPGPEHHSGAGHHKVVNVGDHGTGGITIPARLRRAGIDDVTVVEPSSSHHYQPLLTFVGGRCPASVTVRPEADVMPTSLSGNFERRELRSGFHSRCPRYRGQPDLFSQGEMESRRLLPTCDPVLVDVMVQWVRTYWTKRSRGAPGAVRRNALPEAFCLPEAVPPFVHEVRMSECDDFTPHPTVTSGLPPDAQVELTEADAVLRVLLVLQNAPEWASSGLRLRQAIALRPGQTLRWQVNYRFRPDWGWHYRLDTLNVCYGKGSAEVFLGPPAHRIDERSRLR